MLLLAPVSQRPQQRGAALMLATLVMLVVIMIVFQISMSSSTDSRVAKNDLQLTVFDAAIESALLKVMDGLVGDAPTGETGDGGGGAAGFGVAGMAGAVAGEEEAGAVDSRRDEWARPQQTEINGVSLRILVQDEDSKCNVLAMLAEDRKEADAGFERVVRVLDHCREGTLQDIDESDARRMAEAMREFMTARESASIPRPDLLTDGDGGAADFGMPLSLREFVVLPGFNAFMFRDFRDAEGTVVHSLGSFLTVSSSLSTYAEYRSETQPRPGAGGENSGGGATGRTARGAINVNTASNAVLHSLADRSEVSWDFLDELVRYRNLEDEEASDPDAEPIYDEYGEEVIVRQIFEDLEELAKVPGWDLIEPEARKTFSDLLAVESHVFTIFITARASTSREADAGVAMSRAEAQELFEKGTDLLRTVRVTVWRHGEGEQAKIVPLEGWEVLDYTPFEVLDNPEEGR